MIMPWLNVIDELRFLAKKLQCKNGRGRKWPNYWFWSLDNGFNRFLEPKNIGLEYSEALVAIIWIASNFPEKFPRSKKGVVTLSFPELK